MRQGRFLRPLLVSALSLSLLLAFTWSPLLSRPPAALAHAFVIGSDPVDGSTISTPPARVLIFFNAPISSASISHVYLFTASSPFTATPPLAPPTPIHPAKPPYPTTIHLL